MTRLPIALAAAALLFTWSDAEAQRRFFSCDLHLVQAAGVPSGSTHKYRTRGICRETDDRNQVLREGWVEASAKYDVKTAMFVEDLAVTGWGAPSATSIRLKCGDDPMLTSAKCSIHSQNSPANAWPDFVWYWKKGQPLTKQKDMYAKAVELSKQSASTSKSPPPPPPPAAKPKVAIKSMKPLLDAVKKDSAKRVDREPPKRTTPTVPPSPGQSEIPLMTGAKVELASGWSLVALTLDGELRWMILGDDGEVLRTYPAGSKAYRDANGDVVVDWGGGVNNLGKPKPARRLRLPM
jgi:hypothetical protein